MARLSRYVKEMEISDTLTPVAGGVVFRSIDLGCLLVLMDGATLESGIEMPALRLCYANVTLFSDHNSGGGGLQAGVS